MKIVLAFDSFKETFSSLEVASIVKEELLKKDKNLNIKIFEIADGGEGTIGAIYNNLHLNCNNIKKVPTYDGHFNRIKAKILLVSNKCYIESADVVGFKYKKAKDSPSNISSFGIGEIIKYVLNEYMEINEIYLCLGGTTSIDMGCGMMVALGAKFYNKEYKEFVPMGISLNEIVDVDLSKLDEKIENVKFYALSDVKNPLYGLNGASYVFGHQKGASGDEIAKIDEGLINLSNILKEKYKIEKAFDNGAGAAGGMGYGIMAFLKGKILNGIDCILDIINFEDEIVDASLIITGEGKFDFQSLNGKVVSGICNIASKYHKNVLGLFGTIDYKDLDIPKCMIDLYKTNINDIPFEEEKKYVKKHLIECIRRIDIKKYL